MINKIVANRLILIKAINEAVKALIDYNTFYLTFYNKFVTLQNDEFLCDKFYTEHKNYFKFIAKNIISNKEHYLAISLDDNNKISYSLRSNEKFNHAKRIKTTLSKYIVRQIIKKHKEIFDDSIDYSELVDKFYKIVSEKLPNHNPKIKSYIGYDICKYYESCHSGPMASCMTKNDGNFTELYALNPDKVQLLVYDDSLRALLWTIDNNTKILDRIYPSGHFKINQFVQYAKKNGYIIKKHVDSMSAYDFLNEKKYYIELKHKGVFPYIDTFQFGKLENNIVKISNDVTFGNLAFTTTHGKYRKRILSEDSDVCMGCDEIIDDAFFSNNGTGPYCEDCYNEIYCLCSACSDEIYVENSYNVETEPMCDECFHNRDIDLCSECHDYFYNKNLFKYKSSIDVDKIIYLCKHCADNEEIKFKCQCCDDMYIKNSTHKYYFNKLLRVQQYTFYNILDNSSHIYCRHCFENEFKNTTNEQYKYNSVNKNYFSSIYLLLNYINIFYPQNNSINISTTHIKQEYNCVSGNKENYISVIERYRE